MPFSQLSRDKRMSIIKRTTARGAWESAKPGSLHCGNAKLEYAHRASNRESKQCILLLGEKRCQILSETRTVQIRHTTCFALRAELRVPIWNRSTEARKFSKACTEMGVRTPPW